MQWIDSRNFAHHDSPPIEGIETPAFSRWPQPILGPADARGWATGLAGEPIRVRVHSDQVMGRFSMIESMAAPGAESLVVRHDASDIVVNVSRGRLRLFLDGRAHDIEEGSVAALARGTSFGWRNVGDVPLVMLTTYTPGGIEDLLRACVGAGGDDLAYVARTFGTEIMGPVPSQYSQ